jgi:Tol biopolymer transport system component
VAKRLVLTVAVVASLAACSALTRQSVSSAREQGNDFSDNLVINGNGKLVAFASAATNLVAGDTNEQVDVFFRDVPTGTTTRLGSPSGEQPDGTSIPAAMSDNGRYLAFTSDATNLSPNDTNGENDVFVVDRSTGMIERLTNTATGAAPNGSSSAVDMSADGRHVLFSSAATNMPGADVSRTNLFIADRVARTTTRITRTGEADLCDDPPTVYASFFPAAMSADGSEIAYVQRCTVSTTIAAVAVYLDRSTGQRTTMAIAIRRTVDEQFADIDIADDGSFVAWVYRSSNGGHPQMMVWQPGGTPTPVTEDDAQELDISGDGRYIAYATAAYVSGRSPFDVRVLDRESNEAVSVVQTIDGEAPRPSRFEQEDFRMVHISRDGSTVGFSSAATNLVASDTNDTFDVFTTGVQAAFDRAASAQPPG